VCIKKESEGNKREVERLIRENGQSMRDFYQLSQEERNEVLDKISQTNDLIEKNKNTP
jgi:hypothetical protein